MINQNNQLNHHNPESDKIRSSPKAMITVILFAVYKISLFLRQLFFIENAPAVSPNSLIPALTAGVVIYNLPFVIPAFLV